MSDNDFGGQILADKLAKLNSSQQSIESLSRWCITHRKKAKQIVETWENVFKSAPQEQHVSFLYLANDILQNSRRKGSEFVNEFWKFLPAALHYVYDGGDENGKKVASRLVDIWEERKVFGSRGQNLKDEMLGKNPPPSTVSNGKTSNSIKVVKKDAQSLRIKLAVGGLPEKIISAFQLVHEENVNEEAAFNKCKSVISGVKELGKDIENSSASGNPQVSELVEKIQEQENTLRACISQLEKVEATRLALVSQLKEAVQDQESKLELIHSELQVARGQIEQTIYVKQKLMSSSHPQLTAGNTLMEAVSVAEVNLSSTQSTSSPLLQPSHAMTFTTSKLNEEESKKAAAAAVAAKLAASTSSAQMLTSVLSSLVAEEFASMSNGLNSARFSSSLAFSSPEKRPKLEKPASFSDVNHSEGGHSSFFAAGQQTISNMSVGPPNVVQLISQGNQIQASFPQPPPPPPPPPSTPPANLPANQIGQSAAMMIGVPYGYGSSNLPPPPLPAHMQMGFARPASLPTQQQPPQQLQNQQSQPQPQPPPATTGYYRPPGIGFYGQSHQSATPSVPRQ